MLDLNTPGGKFTERITIAAVPDRGESKLQYVDVKGFQKNLKIWATDLPKLAKPLTAGAEDVAEIHVVEEEYPKNSGKKIVSAYLRSFGGPNKGGDGKRSFTPPREPSFEEIHGLAVAQVVCAAIAMSKDSGWGEPAIHYMTRVGIHAYANGLRDLKLELSGAANTVPPAPAPAPPTEEPTPTQAGKLEGEWFKEIGGTSEQFEELRRVCKAIEREWVALLREYQAAGYTDANVLMREVRPLLLGPEEDPAFGMTGPEARAAYYVIADSFKWPAPSEAGVVCTTVFAGWLDGKRIVDWTRGPSDDDWRAIYRGAFRVKSGDPEPAAFVRWKSENLTGARTNGS